MGWKITYMPTAATRSAEYNTGTISHSTLMNNTTGAPSVDKMPKKPTYLNYDPAVEPAPVPGIGHHAIVPIVGWKIGITQLTGSERPPSASWLVPMVLKMQAIKTEEWEGNEDPEHKYRLVRCRTQQSFTKWGGHSQFTSVNTFAYGHKSPPHMPPDGSGEWFVPDWDESVWPTDPGDKIITPVSLNEITRAAFAIALSPGNTAVGLCKVEGCFSCTRALHAAQLTPRNAAIANCITPGTKPPTYLVAGVKWGDFGVGCVCCGRSVRAYYRSDDYGNNYCLSCYQRVYRQIIDNSPVDGWPTWYTRSASGQWRWATPSEEHAYAEVYADNYLLLPGTYAADAGRQGGAFKGRPEMPYTDRLIVAPATSVRDGQFTSSPDLLFAAGNSGQLWRAPVPCAYCGCGGEIYRQSVRTGRTSLQRVELGNFHSSCWDAFFANHLSEWDLVSHDCGALARVEDVVQVDKPDVAATCKMCEESYYPEKVNWRPSFCPSCYSRDTELRAANHCWRCTPYVQHRSGRATLMRDTGIDAGFPLAMAMADFYMLQEMAIFDEAAAHMADTVADKLAQTLADYGTAVCGGELRHHVGSRTNRLVLEYLSNRAPTADQEDGLCVKCGIVPKTHKVAGEIGHRVNYILSVRGAVNGTPYPAPPKKGVQPHAARGAFMYSQNIRNKLPWKINGVEYQCYEPPAPFDALVDSLKKITGSESERPAAWKKWARASKQHGMVAAMQVCRDMFMTGEWRPSMGGYWWGLIADSVLRYAKGEMPAAIFVDTIFGLEHNGATVFNKIYKTHNLDSLLDKRRTTITGAILWPWASAKVVDMYIESAKRSGDQTRLWYAAHMVATRSSDSYLTRLDALKIFEGYHLKNLLGWPTAVQAKPPGRLRRAVSKYGKASAPKVKAQKKGATVNGLV